MAFRLAKVKPGKNFTYGYSKTTVLVALANAVILLVAVGGIGYEVTNLPRFRPIDVGPVGFMGRS
jgi:cobalt-zinc-cadmium efflux system protein